MKKGCGLYRFFKPILGPLFKFYYNPKIYGTENLKVEGRAIFAGNHIHVYDQCNIIIKCKRSIYFMAKKEYFEGNLAWFFSSVGCIPVDRSIKDIKAKTSALEVLENDHLLGIFPEGTRNGVKKEKAEDIYNKYSKDLKIDFKKFFNNLRNVKYSELLYLDDLVDKKVIKKKNFINHYMDVDRYLLELVKKKIITMDDYLDHIFLPFKYGTVSMAYKTKSVIIPYVITGTYKFRSKDLVVRIGEAIIPNEDLEKTNKLLRSKMIDLYKESLHIK